MKLTFSIIPLLLYLTALLTPNPKSIPLYSIPSYDVTVNGYAQFLEKMSPVIKNQSKAKREMNVQVRSTGGTPGQATIWIYSLDHTTILGPYTITGGQTVTVPIDDREWGVLVESEEDVEADVWITLG